MEVIFILFYLKKHFEPNVQTKNTFDKKQHKNNTTTEKQKNIFKNKNECRNKVWEHSGDNHLKNCRDNIIVKIVVLEVV